MLRKKSEEERIKRKEKWTSVLQPAERSSGPRSDKGPLAAMLRKFFRRSFHKVADTESN